MAINLNLSASKGLRLAIGLSSLLIATLSVSDSSAQSTEPLQSSTLVSNDVDEVPENAARNSPLVSPAPLPNPIAGQIQPSSFRALAIAAAPSAHTMGAFGTPHNWPIMPIAMMLMPNGTVFAYGTDTGANAKQDTQQYAVWNTAIDPDWNPPNPSTAFQLLPNGTGSNIFCSAQVHLLPNRALIIGGDVDNNLGFATNDGNNNVVVFESKINIEEPPSITNREKMPWPRWYPTAVTLPNRTTLVLGGRMTAPEMNGDGPDDDVPATYPPSTPYIRVPGMPVKWTALGNAGGADGNSAYGSSVVGNSWFYPRAWVDPRGKVFILTHSGKMFKLDTTVDAGKLTDYGLNTFGSLTNLSSVMFTPEKILSIRNGKKAIVVDITRDVPAPAVTQIPDLIRDRQYGSLTVLADGKVWANGGTSYRAKNTSNAELNDERAGTNLDSEIWDPRYPGAPWKATASALYSRHYHSSALLLPDGSVMTAGGGSPGPWTNLNGEIYYPPYLFKSDDTPAPRPTIRSIVNGSSFSLTRIGWNRPMTITAGTEAGVNNKINRITLVRAGAATHTFNNETRFFELTIPRLEVGTRVVTVLTPLNANVAPPGYYMVFMWNEDGVPSVAKIIEIS